MPEIKINQDQILTAADKASQLAAEAEEAARGQALAYLAETDWHVTRMVETGVAIPNDVSKARAEAREVLK